MLNFIKSKLKQFEFNNKLQEENIENSNPSGIKTSLVENSVAMRGAFSNSSDLTVKEMVVSNIPVEMYLCEGMINGVYISKMLISPLMALNLKGNSNPSGLLDYIFNKSMLSHDVIEITTLDDAMYFVMSGFVVMFIEGATKGVAFGMQGFNFRGVGEPENEANERGSKEGFTEPLRINVSMIRRRVKSPNLVFEFDKVGKSAKTEICYAYMSDRVSKELLLEIKRRIKSANIDILLDSAYLVPYIEIGQRSIFSSVGYTERPDTLGAKIAEGKVAVLVDGTPFAIIMPYLFAEHFQSFDDYSHSAYFASFVRIIKYIAFFISVFLAGIYVAVSTYHPEIIPKPLLINIVKAQESAPMPLVLEAVFINLVYEIMREAGLRLPKPIGHAVGILGALVIGDAAVTAGIIGAPMVMVIALTAISSFVVHQLYEPISFLRFLFIILGGTSGLLGITLGAVFVGFNISALDSIGIPYLSPISPLKPKLLRDVFIRGNMRKLSQNRFLVQDLATKTKNMEG